MTSKNPAWRALDAITDFRVAKSDGKVSRAKVYTQVLNEFPELYELGGGTHGIAAFEVEEEEPIAKRAEDSILEPIAKAARERAAKSGESYYKAYVDELLKDPERYERYRRERMGGLDRR